jgi:hypothetical protein
MLLTVFLAGGFIGAWTMRQVHRRFHEMPTFEPKSGAKLSYDQLKEELNLSPEQALKLKTILDDFVKYNEDIQSQIEDYRATGKNRIRSILTPDQERQFEKLCDQVQTR